MSTALTTSVITSLEKDLRTDEGVRSKPYRDSLGFLTIGVGHNLDAEGLCEEAISAQLRHDLERVTTSLPRALPWLLEAPEPVQRVVLNMGFNLGIPKLLGFTTFLSLLERGDYQGAARDLLLTTYAKQVKMRALRLAGLLQGVVK